MTNQFCHSGLNFQTAATEIVSILLNLLMSAHNIYFRGEIRNIIYLFGQAVYI